MDEKMSTLSSRFSDFEEGREKIEDHTELERQQKGLKSNAGWLEIPRKAVRKWGENN